MCGAALWRCREIRHNLVHRMGVVDKKLIEACPWFRLKENKQYGLTREHIKGYSTCIKYYIMEIDRRIRTHFGEPIPPHAQKLYEFYLSAFDDQAGSLICPSYDSGHGGHP